MTNDEPLRIKSHADAARPGFVPTDDDLYWVRAMRDLLTGSIQSSQTAALAVIVCALTGWVTAVLLGLRDRPPSVTHLVIWLLPLFWWSGAIVWALRVFSIRRYRFFANSPDSAHKALVRITRRKTGHLFWAVAFWVAGAIAFVCAILSGSVYP